jgi:NAD(P)-dependent dehydrogenase (short-subunit alcohol dehydrogenase family)
MGLPTPTRGVITGAASGLGRAFAVELAGRGARLLLADVDEVGLAETARLVRDKGGEAKVTRCDVRDEAAVVALAERADETLGGTDLLINNAGVAVGGDFAQIPMDDWRWVMDVNLWGVVYGCHVFVPRMVRQGRGFVLNVASAAGLLAPPRMAPYNVAKAGVVALSETLHAEFADRGVRVSVLCPTFFETGLLRTARVTDQKMTGSVERQMRANKVQAQGVARAGLEAVARGQLYAVPMRDGRIFWRLKRALPAMFPAVAAWGVRAASRRRPAGSTDPSATS